MSAPTIIRPPRVARGLVSAVGATIAALPIVAVVEASHVGVGRAGLYALIGVGAGVAIFEACTRGTGQAFVVWVLLLAAMVIDRTVMSEHIRSAVDTSTPLGMLTGYFIRSQGWTGVTLALLLFLHRFLGLDASHYLVAAAVGWLIAESLFRWGQLLRSPLRALSGTIARRIPAFIMLYLTIAVYFAAANLLAAQYLGGAAFGRKEVPSFAACLYYSVMVLAAGEAANFEPGHPLTMTLRAIETLVGVFTLAIYLSLVLTDVRDQHPAAHGSPPMP